MRGILQLRPWIVLMLALALTAAIAITDWKVVFEATLGSNGTYAAIAC